MNDLGCYVNISNSNMPDSSVESHYTINDEKFLNGGVWFEFNSLTRWSNGKTVFANIAAVGLSSNSALRIFKIKYNYSLFSGWFE